MLFLIGSYLVLVFVLPIALSAAVTYRALPLGRRCPHCRDDTILLVNPRLRLVSRLRPLMLLQRRWCLGCGWEGVVRVERRAAQQSIPAPVRATLTLDLRSLTVDGRAWRVMLQCWNQTGVCHGRLVFIAPTGRLWPDAVEAFTGESPTEVLGQAQAIPDGLLTNRLRRLVDDY